MRRDALRSPCREYDCFGRNICAGRSFRSPYRPAHTVGLSTYRRRQVTGMTIHRGWCWLASVATTVPLTKASASRCMNDAMRERCATRKNLAYVVILYEPRWLPPIAVVKAARASVLTAYRRRSAPLPRSDLRLRNGVWGIAFSLRRAYFSVWVGRGRAPAVQQATHTRLL